MRRASLFWGGALVVLGVLLLLENLGILKVDVSSMFWPLLVIAVGLWMVWSVASPSVSETREVAIPLDGASRASVRLDYGAGRLHISASAGADELLSGTFGGGVDYRPQRDGDTLRVKMEPPWQGNFVPFGPLWGSRYDWSFGLNKMIPLSLNLKSGASANELDFTDLRLTDLRLETGASSTELTLPANAGQTKVDIEAGAASVVIRIPQTVAARIRVRSGVSGVSVSSRFPRLGDYYQSPDYDSAQNKADVHVEMGAGSVEIR